MKREDKKRERLDQRAKEQTAKTEQKGRAEAEKKKQEKAVLVPRSTYPPAEIIRENAVPAMNTKPAVALSAAGAGGNAELHLQWSAERNEEEKLRHERWLESQALRAMATVATS